MECCGDASCLRIPIDREESNVRKDKGITMAQLGYKLYCGPWALGVYIRQAPMPMVYLLHICIYVSLSTLVLNSRDRQGMYGMQHFRTPRNTPYNRL